jgi:hypothetical protein
VEKVRIRNLDFFKKGGHGPCGHTTNEGFDDGIEEFGWEAVHAGNIAGRRKKSKRIYSN